MLQYQQNMLLAITAGFYPLQYSIYLEFPLVQFNKLVWPHTAELDDRTVHQLQLKNGVSGARNIISRFYRPCLSIINLSVVVV